MTRLSSLNKAQTFVIGLLEVHFADATVRLLEGPAPEVYLGNTYYGEHSDWGSIATLEGYSREVGELPSGWRFILRATPWLINKARDQSAQGAAVRVYVGEIDPDLGLINMELDRQGAVNIMKINHGIPGAIEFEVSSTPDYMADPDERLTLSPNGQKRLDPNDKFCEFMTKVDIELPWGNKNSATPVLGQGTAGGGNGGGGGKGGTGSGGAINPIPGYQGGARWLQTY